MVLIPRSSFPPINSVPNQECEGDEEGARLRGGPIQKWGTTPHLSYLPMIKQLEEDEWPVDKLEKGPKRY